MHPSPIMYSFLLPYPHFSLRSKTVRRARSFLQKKRETVVSTDLVPIGPIIYLQCCLRGIARALFIRPRYLFNNIYDRGVNRILLSTLKKETACRSGFFSLFNKYLQHKAVNLIDKYNINLNMK